MDYQAGVRAIYTVLQAHAITTYISYNLFHTALYDCVAYYVTVFMVPLRLLNFTTMNLLVNTQVMHSPTSKGTTDSRRSKARASFLRRLQASKVVTRSFLDFHTGTSSAQNEGGANERKIQSMMATFG